LVIVPVVVPFCRTDTSDNGAPVSSLTTPVSCRVWLNAKKGSERKKMANTESSRFFIIAIFIWL